MNPYAMLSADADSSEALSLRARLSEWHDAMVAHERRLRIRGASDSCDEDCPHAAAPALWSEAVAVFGPGADRLTFLRSHAGAKPPPASSVAAVEWRAG